MSLKNQNLVFLDQNFNLINGFFLGLISIMGGKWTTYRRMSEETVDEAVKLLKGNLITH